MNLDRCVQQALDLLSEDVKSQFTADPERTIREALAMTVTPVDHLTESRADGGACDGLSFLQDGVILYAPTPNSRRQNFTLAHELGHVLAEQADDIYDWIADQDEPGRLLETVCDRIAQSLLLPESVTTAVVAGSTITAHHVVKLYEASQASRPACAIALAKHLPSLGAIAIIDKYSGLVSFASIKPDPDQGWPAVFPWRDQELPPGHPLRTLASGATSSRRLTWRTPWGAQADFYCNALSDHKRTYAVLSDQDLWGIESFHPPIEREFDTRPALTGTCCGTQFERRGYPCPDCNQPYCPRCGECRCQREAKTALTCTRCFLQFAPHLVVDGICTDCRC